MAKSSVLSRVGRGIGAAAQSFGNSMQARAIRDTEDAQENKRALEAKEAEAERIRVADRQAKAEETRLTIQKFSAETGRLATILTNNTQNRQITVEQTDRHVENFLRVKIKEAELLATANLQAKQISADKESATVDHANAKDLATHQGSIQTTLNNNISELKMIQEARKMGMQLEAQEAAQLGTFLQLPMPDEEEDPKGFAAWKVQSDRYDVIKNRAQAHISDLSGKQQNDDGSFRTNEEMISEGDARRLRDNPAPPAMEEGEEETSGGLSMNVYNTVRERGFDDRALFWVEQVDNGKMTVEQVASAELSMFGDDLLQIPGAIASFFNPVRAMRSTIAAAMEEVMKGHRAHLAEQANTPQGGLSANPPIDPNAPQIGGAPNPSPPSGSSEGQEINFGPGRAEGVPLPKDTVSEDIISGVNDGTISVDELAKWMQENGGQRPAKQGEQSNAAKVNRDGKQTGWDDGVGLTSDNPEVLKVMRAIRDGSLNVRNARGGVETASI